MITDFYFTTEKNKLMAIDFDLNSLNDKTILEEAYIRCVSEDNFTNEIFTNTYEEKYLKVTFKKYYDNIKELLVENYDLKFRTYKEASINDNFRSLLEILSNIKACDIDEDYIEIGFSLKK